MPIWCTEVGLFIFLNATATTDISTLSLHASLPISGAGRERLGDQRVRAAVGVRRHPRERQRADALRRLANRPAQRGQQDRKSTRLNSSHANISYAVLCLKKRKISSSYMTETSSNSS